MPRDTLDFGGALFAHFFKKRHQGVLVKPCAGFGCCAIAWQGLRRRSWTQVAEHSRVAQGGLPVRLRLDGKQPLVNRVGETIDDLGAIEIDSHRRSDIQRVEAGAVGQ